jgi:pyrroloquinoline quinone biosynthesis protein B
VRLKVLGSGQDAGIPQTGCYCTVCSRARSNSKYRRLSPSIALFDKGVGFCYLVDASPDFKSQIHSIQKEIKQVERKGKIPISGILLTHAHVGHYVGLWHLGKEALNEKDVPVFCTSSMKAFLSASPAFRFMLQSRVISVREIRPQAKFALGGLSALPIEVPHRSEIADTVGFIIEAEKRVIYIPDTDHWTGEMIEEIAESDLALIDGTFYSRSELPHFEEVPHPPIEETVDILRDISTEIYFTHINHTNPVNRRGRERRSLEGKGFKVAYDGLVLEI